MLALRDGFSQTNALRLRLPRNQPVSAQIPHIWLSWISRGPDVGWIWANTMLLSELISKRPQVFSSGLSHPLDWLNDSLSSPPVAGVWWAHWCRCPVVAVALFKWMLHTGCGWGETPPPPPPPHDCALGVQQHTIKHYIKCIIHSTNQMTTEFST